MASAKPEYVVRSADSVIPLSSKLAGRRLPVQDVVIDRQNVRVSPDGGSS